MSKSLGNFFLLREILDKFPGPVVRFYLMSTHYRSPLDFDDQKLAAAEKSLRRIENTYRTVEEKLALAKKSGGDADGKKEKLIAICDEARAKVIEAMDDDFNTSLALAAIFDVCKEVNTIVNDKTFSCDAETAVGLGAVIDFFREMNGIFDVIVPGTEEDDGDDGLADDLLKMVIALRAKARENKDWDTADFIRDELKIPKTVPAGRKKAADAKNVMAGSRFSACADVGLYRRRRL